MFHSSMSRSSVMAIRMMSIWLILVVPVLAGEAAQKTPQTDPGHGEKNGILTMADAIASTLQNSPELAAFSWDLRAAEARQLQARLRPNPELQIEIEDIRLGTGPGTRTKTTALGLSSNGPSAQIEHDAETGARSGLSEAQYTVSLSQLIELGGKRAKRIQLAERDRDVSNWDYEVARADVLKNTAQAFIAVLAAQKRVTLDDELVQIAEQVSDTVSARVNAGRVSPLEATKAQTALSTAKVQANASRQNLESVRATLAASWGDKEARFERVAGNLEEIHALPALDELRTRIKQNPDLSLWQAEIAKRQSAIVVEKSKAIPDITVGAGFRTVKMPERDSYSMGLGSDGISGSRSSSNSDKDWDNSVVLGVSVPLPLFDRNQGSIQEAEHLASKASEEKRATTVQIQAQLTRGYQALCTAHTTLSSLKENILPAATQTFDAINNAYKQGKFGYLDVLDAQRTLFEARRQYLDGLAAYHESVAEIERIIGESLWKKENANPVAQEVK